MRQARDEGEGGHGIDLTFVGNRLLLDRDRAAFGIHQRAGDHITRLRRQDNTSAICRRIAQKHVIDHTIDFTLLVVGARIQFHEIVGAVRDQVLPDANGLSRRKSTRHGRIRTAHFVKREDKEPVRARADVDLLDRETCGRDILNGTADVLTRQELNLEARRGALVRQRYEAVARVRLNLTGDLGLDPFAARGCLLQRICGARNQVVPRRRRGAAGNGLGGRIRCAFQRELEVPVVRDRVRDGLGNLNVAILHAVDLGLRRIRHLRPGDLGRIADENVTAAVNIVGELLAALRRRVDQGLVQIEGSEGLHHLGVGDVDRVV